MEKISSHHNRVEAGRRLMSARKSAGFRSQKKASDVLNMNEETYKKKEQGVNGFSPSQAREYGKLFKVSPHWLLFGDDVTGDNLTNSTKYAVVAFPNIKILGKVRAGAWFDIEEIGGGEDDNMSYVPGSGEHPPEWQYAFEVDGESINRVASQGDILICIDMNLSGMSLASIGDGDLVIVERSRHGGHIIERTAKRLRRTSAGYDLWPDSDHKDHQNPIPINGSSDGEEIRVKAKVVWVLRKP